MITLAANCRNIQLTTSEKRLVFSIDDSMLAQMGFQGTLGSSEKKLEFISKFKSEWLPYRM
jgi:hypothetical protein